MKKYKFKYIQIGIVFLVIGFNLKAQEKHTIISAYTLKMDTDQGAQYLDALAKFINADQTHLKAIENKLSDLVLALNSKITIDSSTSFLSEPFYKYMLDEYESAPKNVKFTLTGLGTSIHDPLVLKTDYRMSEYHVFTIGEYLPIGTGRPFNNDGAIETLIQNLPESDAFIILEFSPSLSYMGNTYGMGESGVNLSLHMKILNTKNKLIFKNTISAGSKDFKFQVAGNTEPNMDDVLKAFELAFDNLLVKLDKFDKKLTKLKY